MSLRETILNFNVPTRDETFCVNTLSATSRILNTTYEDQWKNTETGVVIIWDLSKIRQF